MISKIFPKTKYCTIYLGKKEYLGIYENGFVFVNRYPSHKRVSQPLLIWIIGHELVHHFLRKTPTLDRIFERIHFMIRPESRRR